MVVLRLGMLMCLGGGSGVVESVAGVQFAGRFSWSPVIMLQIFSMAVNLQCCVGGCPLIVFSRFFMALVMRSAGVMAGVGRVWWRNVKVSVRRTVPVSVTALMHW